MDATATALQPGTDLVDAGSQAVVPATPAGPLTPLQRIQTLPPRQKWVAAGGVIALLALMVLMSVLNKAENYAPLFTGSITERDAGAAIAQLKLMEVPYKVSDGGNTIMVPSNMAGELRMRMASAGLPKGSVSGFELLDNPRFGMSQQQERTSLQRALEGELTRSVRSIGALEDARVHLAMPAANGFFREQVKPSASVIVSLRPGHILDRSQIAGIVHLVSSSVPDLSPKAVSIIDQDGSLLSQSPDGDSRLQDLTQQQRKHVQEIEQTLLKRVNEILEPSLGQKNLRATVTAELDFNQIESTSEAYGPNQSANAAAIRSQRQIEANTPGDVLPAGVPGAAANEPPAQATAPLTGASQPLKGAGEGGLGPNGRKESQINYELDRKVQMMRNAVGTIKRVNVAVVVNHREATDAKGKTTSEPLPQEELDKLTALVQEAVGYKGDRGDSVKVVSMPFRSDLYPTPEVLPWWKEDWVLPMAKTVGVPLVMLLVALTLVFAVIRPALKKEEPPEPDPALDAVVDDAEALPGEEGEPEDEDYSPFLAQQLEDARILAMNNPLGVANILRTWMHGEEAAV